MRFLLPTSELFVPDGVAPEQAVARTTHLAVSAHQDDLEIMAFDGIRACFQQPDKWFCGVVVTNGAGSPRDDLYKNFTDAEMMVVRRKEQKKAAIVGEDGAMALLDYPSGPIKDGKDRRAVEDLTALLAAAKPQVVYTHNLGDKHDTHVGVCLKTIAAIRALPKADRPQKVYGCEVWRDLDWMIDADKVTFDCSTHENLQAALLGVFDSQICGGKRYDLATLGRRKAHSTYAASHGTDTTTGLTFGMDLTPLIQDDTLDPAVFIFAFIERFRQEVDARLVKLT